ncbi:glycosyltransferase [Aquibacillus halophilus]|uniref:glycosyltransferase n=1 Tax=Aquibacillus halophilus TaxID=930132 RepID=UPI00129B9187
MFYSIIIPAFNESKSIAKVLRALVESYPNSEIIVVDDYSTDDTAEVVEDFSEVTLIKQPYNQGPIIALATGIAAASNDVVVTIDADGQHPIDYIPKLVEPIFTDQADIVLGVREKLPRLGEKIITLFSGVSDATTGFKAMRKTCVDEYYTNDFAYGGVFISVSKKRGFRVLEVPVPIQQRLEGVSTHSNIKILTRSFKFVLWKLFKMRSLERISN